jgi:hypothetical protein
MAVIATGHGYALAVKALTGTIFQSSSAPPAIRSVLLPGGFRAPFHLKAGCDWASKWRCHDLPSLLTWKAWINDS